MKNTTGVRLTKLQREVLEALRDGGVITLDRMNMASLGDRSLSPQTRYFLTENRLIERRDKTKSVETQGNGFIISSKGMAVLCALATSSQSTETAAKRDSPDIRAQSATERQLAYAKDLGISVPDGASKEEVSDLIDAQTLRNKNL